MKTYQFKLKPAKAQTQIFEQWPGCCRYVYNLCLNYKKTVYEQYKVNLSKYEIQKELALIAGETRWIGCVYSQTLQEVTDRVFRSYDNFFRGAGFLKFARKRFYHSFTFKQGVKILPNTHKIQLPKIGKVSYRKSGEVEGKIKTATIIKKTDGWYVSLSCEVNINSLPEVEQTIGIDVVITTLASLSNGGKIENPKILQKYEYKLRKLQRSVCRKKKGSNSRRKAVNKLAKYHLKISNKRKDYLHDHTTKLVRENQLMAVEDLQISNLLKNHRLAKSIAAANWHQFFNFLEYKCHWYGKSFNKVSPKNTSKTCSCCGFVVDQMPLAIRIWQCPSCEVIHDRDVNASKNIGRRAYAVSLGDRIQPEVQG